MIKRSLVKAAQDRTAAMFEQIGIVLSEVERNRIEISEFGLGELERQGLELVTYINMDRYCAKDLVLFPRQTCPEHRHPMINGEPGKMETFRCRWGKILLYVEGAPAEQIQAHIPEGSEAYYTVFHEIELSAGEQYTIAPDTLHWFQSREEGAVVSEFSSTSRDEYDIFTDVRIQRIPQIEENEG